MMMLLKVLPMCQMHGIVERRKSREDKILTATSDHREMKWVCAKVVLIAQSFRQVSANLETAVNSSMTFVSI